MVKIADRIRALFVNILEHPERLKIVGKTWNEVYAGNVEFNFDGTRLVIFNDCDSFDYVDEIVFSNGARWGTGKGFGKELRDIVDEVSGEYSDELGEIFSRTGEAG